MSRIEVLTAALSSHPYLDLQYRPDDEVLRANFAKLKPERQEQLRNLIDFGTLDAPAGQPHSPIADLAYRLTDLSSLPTFLRRVTVLADDYESSDVMMLSTLGIVSAFLPCIHGSLMDETVLSNLYVMLTGPAASGKGKACQCTDLMRPVYRYAPIRIAGNSSSTAIYRELYENRGLGIIFETELDTLSQAFRNGDFSDGLRKAFHHEPISYHRRTRDERVYIDYPQLSMVLTGTPLQVPLLLKSPENGLFSRFLYYRLMARKESFVQTHTSDITATDVHDYLYLVGQDLAKLFVKLFQHEPIEFKLSEQQNTEFLQHFNRLTTSFETLASRAYQNEMAVEQMTGICRRMGNICYRILMILSAMRLMDDLEANIPNELTCCDDDFNQVLRWSENLMFHSLIHFDEILLTSGLVEDSEEPDFDSPDLLSEGQRQLWKLLPERFTKQEALQIAVQNDLAKSSLDRYLALFCELGMLSRYQRGCYKKNA